MDIKRRIKNRTSVIMAGCFFIVFWFFTDNPGLLYAAISVAVISLVTYLIQVFILRKISAEITAPAGLFHKNGDVVFSLKVSNGSVLPLLVCYAEIEMKNLFTGETEKRMISVDTVKKGESVTEFKVSPSRCGCMTAEIKSIITEDIFGVLSRKKKIAGASVSKAVVFPDLYPVQVLFTGEFNSTEGDNTVCTQRKSLENDSSSLRSFVPGDSLKNVHWKLSEKTGELILREGALHESDRVTVIWDPTGGENDPDKADKLASAVASVCYALTDEGANFELICSPQNNDLWYGVDAVNEIQSKISYALSSDIIPDFINDIPDTGGRILYFSMRLPEKKTDNADYYCCESDETAGCTLIDKPLSELVI